MAAELWSVSRKILLGLGFSPRGQFMVQRAVSGGARGCHTTPRRGLGFSLAEPTCWACIGRIRTPMEAMASMKKALGVNPHPGRVPKQELLTPETRFRDGGGAPGVFLEYDRYI